MTDDLLDVSSGVVCYEICHPRHACLTITNNSRVGLSVPNRSIQKYHALPPGDYNYTKCRRFTRNLKGTMKLMSHNPVFTSLCGVLLFTCLK